jgi:hypothetical protein
MTPPNVSPLISPPDVCTLADRSYGDPSRWSKACSTGEPGSITSRRRSPSVRRWRAPGDAWGRGRSSSSLPGAPCPSDGSSGPVSAPYGSPCRQIRACGCTCRTSAPRPRTAPWPARGKKGARGMRRPRRANGRDDGGLRAYRRRKSRAGCGPRSRSPRPALRQGRGPAPQTANPFAAIICCPVPRRPMAAFACDSQWTGCRAGRDQEVNGVRGSALRSYRSGSPTSVNGAQATGLAACSAGSSRTARVACRSAWARDRSAAARSATRVAGIRRAAMSSRTDQ